MTVCVPWPVPLQTSCDELLWQVVLPLWQTSHSSATASHRPAAHCLLRSQPVCVALQISKRSPLQRFWFGKHVAAVQAWADSLQGAAVEQCSLSSKPVWAALQICKSMLSQA
jgi:hypothetical protein